MCLGGRGPGRRKMKKMKKLKIEKVEKLNEMKKTIFFF